MKNNTRRSVLMALSNADILVVMDIRLDLQRGSKNSQNQYRTKKT